MRRQAVTKTVRPVLSVMLIGVLLIAGAALAGCSDKEQTSAATVSGFADFPHYDTVREVAAAADVIVTGKVVKVETRDININIGPDRETNPAVMKCDVSLIEVKRVIKGNVNKGDTIEVKQEAALAGAQESRMKERNGVGVFFLVTYPYGVPCSLVNPEQGMVAIENGQPRPHSGNALFGGARTEDGLVSEIESALK